MPPAYRVRARVVDIRGDTPKPTDAFLVDTNVWFWAAYARASLGLKPPLAYQLLTYPSYLTKALTAKATLYRCGLCLAELTHLIEKTEREIYGAAHGAISAKEYRHNFPAERANVVAEVRAAWAGAKGVSAPLAVNVDDPTTDAALVRFQTQLLDGYDLFLLEGIGTAGVTQVLTDDGDYCTAPGIQVFTANANVVAAAVSQGMLLTR